MEPEGKIVYIAGKMNGVEKFNEGAFTEADAMLVQLGFKTVNPHVINKGRDHEKEKLACMENDIIHLLKCTHIYMIEGWENSRGATLEYEIAKYFRKKRVFVIKQQMLGRVDHHLHIQQL
jgi:hypothetical protein